MRISTDTLFRPSVFLLYVGGVIWLAFQLIPAQTYIELFYSRKVNGPGLAGLLFALLGVATLFAAVGEQVGRIRNARTVMSLKRTAVSLPRWWVIGALLFSIAAYILWFGLGMIRAGGLLGLYAAYRENAFFVKEVLLKPVSGLTSFTQLAVIAVPLAVLNVNSRRTERCLVALILLLAIIRSFLYSERLALLEILIPLLVIWAIRRRLSVGRTLGLAILFFFLIIGFFILNETERSFAVRGVSELPNLISLGTYRFFGYYLTSVNNFGLAVDVYPFRFPFYFTLLGLWSLPGLDNLYTIISGTPVFDAPKILAVNRLNPELNVFTTPGYWIMEYGIPGSLFASATYGFLSGLFYANARKSSYWLAFYAVWFVGIMEFMRIYYFGSPRVFIPMVFFALTIVLVKLQNFRERLKYEFSG